MGFGSGEAIDLAASKYTYYIERESIVVPHWQANATKLIESWKKLKKNKRVWQCVIS